MVHTTQKGQRQGSWLNHENVKLRQNQTFHVDQATSLKPNQPPISHFCIFLSSEKASSSFLHTSTNQQPSNYLISTISLNNEISYFSSHTLSILSNPLSTSTISYIYSLRIGRDAQPWLQMAAKRAPAGWKVILPNADQPSVRPAGAPFPSTKRSLRVHHETTKRPLKWSKK